LLFGLSKRKGEFSGDVEDKEDKGDKEDKEDKEDNPPSKI
jgi:hypothetical protein